jgi:predicted RNA-binding Zn-ribbon protein involved in translation (DUF1610 family)
MRHRSLGVFKSFREVFKELKQGKSAVKVCPACGSSQISLSSCFDAWLMPVQYVCEKCGYKGPIVMEIELQKQLKLNDSEPEDGKKKTNPESQS